MVLRTVAIGTATFTSDSTVGDGIVLFEYLRAGAKIAFPDRVLYVNIERKIYIDILVLVVIQKVRRSLNVCWKLLW